MASHELSNILSFFKALSDESRLKIVGTLATRERSVDDIATLLDLRAPTVSHHLAKLKEIGLVSMRTSGTMHLYQLNVDTLRALSKHVLALNTMEKINEEVVTDAWERKVLRDFLDGERLKEIPSSRKKRDVILSWLARFFESERRYSEKEVNSLIGRHHPDFATLRRELIGSGLLNRERGIYWLP